MIRSLLSFASLLLACASTHPLTEVEIWPISFRRTPCFGPCSAYEVTLLANGQAHMKLTRAQDGSVLSALQPGEYTGSFALDAEAELLPILESLDYFSLDSVYDNPRVMDLPATETTIAGKSVYNRFQGPNLNALYFALDSIVFDVNWSPVRDD